MNSSTSVIDRTPPHYAFRVRDYLNNIFPQDWFGRRGSIEWTPHSPDLIPKGVFFGGCYNKQGVQEESKNNK